MTQNPRTIRELRLELWDAIGSVVAASGGNPGCTSTARQRAVVAVERAVDELLAERDSRIDELHGRLAVFECQQAAEERWLRERGVVDEEGST